MSAVAADIGGVGSTHVNHLTPRVLDIDALYERMRARDITMIDDIQGPPRWQGPDVLLRQTSFRALDEPRTFRLPDRTVTTDALRVRFGEVEARGVAPTREGRARYDAAVAEVAAHGLPSAAERHAAKVEVWQRTFPTTEEEELFDAGLACFEEVVVDERVRRRPIVYEDFLPQSAAGIFQSNLDDDGRRDGSQTGPDRDADWLAGALERELLDPFDLYAAQQERSRHETAALGGRLRP